MKVIIKIGLLLTMMLLTVEQIKAQAWVTVNDESSLRAAIGKGGYIKLANEINEISLTNTLEITTDIILDLNEKTLVYKQSDTGYGESIDAVCLRISSGNVVVKNGKISAIAGKHRTGLGWYAGNNAISLIYSGGNISIYEIILSATKGAGTTSVSDGVNYIYSLENGKKASEMIPFGAYMLSTDYDSSKPEKASETISLSKYTITYFPDNEKDAPIVFDNIDIESILKEPVLGERYGYKGYHWAPDGDYAKVNDIPVLKDRAATGNISFTAQWETISYNITVELNGGNYAAGSSPISSSYNIESETIKLPIPEKVTTGRKYKFMGWYTEPTFAISSEITEISKGSTGDIILYAKWSPIYTIEYEYQSDQAILPTTALTNYVEEDVISPYVLPSLTPKNSTEYSFAGWYENSDYSGNPIISISKKQLHDYVLYGKLSRSYSLLLHWNVDDLKDEISYTEELGVTLPTRGQKKNGYVFDGWYDNNLLTGTKYTEVPAGQKGNKEFYAKWIPLEYNISYDYIYNGTLPKGAPSKYTIEQIITLPMPTRQGYSFVGWHAVDESEDWSETGHGVIPFTFNDQKDQTGNRTFYAEWKGGHILTIQQPEGGKISVKNRTNNQEVESGIAIDKGTSLEISAVATSSTYKFSELLINGKSYTSVPQDVIMPDTCGLTVSAIFVDGRPSASKPEMSTSPVNTDYIPVGESVMVTLKNTDKDATLYYTVDGSKEKAYTQPFMISATTAKKMEVKAIARKEGYRDGVTTRQITFGTGKIVITFDLPEGITAVNPDGGEVVSAVATGGTFEFILDIDESVILSTSQMKVLVNDTLRIYPDANGVYTLEKQKANVKITIAGVVQKDVTVTLIQTKNGQIVFADDETTATRKVNYGDTITVKAIPNAGCYFTKWTDGNTDILRQIIVKNDWNLSAVFSANKYVYKVVFPQIQGVTVKTLSAYSNEVEDGGTCKFYLRLAEEYNQSTPVVYANGEKLEPTKDVYSLYYIHTHYSIAVEGIQRNKEMYALPEHVTGINLETGKSLIDAATLPETQVMVYAKAPDGQVFDKWNDGGKENPRITRASSASHLLPIWKEVSKEVYKVDFMLSAGAGVSAVNAGNASAVLKGENFQFKVVLLPQYSQSPVIVKAGDKVLQPVMELRAATELTTRYYALENLSADTKVEITGLILNNYKPLIEQTKGGKVSVSTSDSVAYGTNITLKATADPGYIFLKWSDGNTLNPYPYKVEGNSNISAVFIGKGLAVDNESIQKEEKAQITITGQTLSIMVAEESMLYIWDYKGSLFRNQKIPVGGYSMDLPAGVYLVKVGDMGTRKIIIR
ncbi:MULTISPECIES: InlB B-repeat-containing protein [Parabacteroides]|uniref:InlB B-repeat-containing protein n=1 Tax=Parabacteroides leei TaxID=2939491 RepID=UPI001898E753|nr:InlB B-repeat-containing protein [Parabacteroides goldsteinii]